MAFVRNIVIGKYMFGYLKPYNEELKQKHIREYKQMYCGLCYGLRKNLGGVSSSLLSNECTFLFIFLDSLFKDDVSAKTALRCPINPFQKTNANLNQELLSYVSFINYHLALLSIRDHYFDSKHVKRWIYKLCYSYLRSRRRYKKLLPIYAKAAERITSACDNLNLLETKKDSTYDECSQQMGQLLVDIIIECPNLPVGALSTSVFTFARHLGMWVYLIDSYDDLEKDIKIGDFNPLCSFLSQGDADALKTCAQLGELMLNLMYSNLCSLAGTIPYYRHREIIENIIVFGTSQAASAAKRKLERKDKKHGKDTGK